MKRYFTNQLNYKLSNSIKYNQQKYNGKISKNIIEKINVSLLEKLKYQQWKNINAVIKWLADINNKDNPKFIQMDIKDIYPSITV